MTAPAIPQYMRTREMTALVLLEIDSMAFVMPEGYTLETTPKPNYNKIKIQQIP